MIKAVVFLLKIVFSIWYSVLSYLIYCCPTLSCPAGLLLCWSRGERCRGQVLLCVDSQCHCAQWEDKDSIEEASMEQGAAQDTLTDRPVFVPSPPFTHTTDTVFSFSPLPALSCLALFLSLPFPLPPLLFFCLEQVGLHWSRHLGCRWEVQIAEGLRTDLGIWGRSLDLQDTKRWN